MKKLRFKKGALVKHIGEDGVFKVIYARGEPSFERLSAIGLLKKIEDEMDRDADYLIQNVRTQVMFSVLEKFLEGAD